MVLYYSATGNTEFIAQEIASGLGDECVNLLDKVKKNDFSPICSEKPFVICAPVIVCEMPRFFSKFLKKVSLCGSKDVYFVFTSGGYSGISGVLAKQIIKKKKMNFLGYADFTMPRNYVASDEYEMLPPEKSIERIEASVKKVSEVVDCIKSGGKLTARHVFLFETLITLPFNPIWCKFKLTAKDFHTDEKCIGCGKCVMLCPLNNVKLEDKRPVWGENCTHCMACIGNCPTEAIEYANVSQNKEKYNFGKYRDKIKNK